MEYTQHSQQLPVSQPEIYDHCITLFYFFKKPVSTEHFDDTALAKTGLPKTQIKTIYKQLDSLGKCDKKDKPAPFWSPCHYETTPDFITSIRQLFHSKEQRPIQSYCIDKTILKLLCNQTLHRNASPSLRLILNNAAKARLEKSGEQRLKPRLCFNGIYCHQFLSGFSVVEVRLQIDSAPSINLLIETLYSLIRLNQISYSEKPVKKDKDKKAEQSMGYLIRSLFGIENSKDIARVYSHTYVQFNKQAKQNDLECLLKKLAHHYNDTYHLNNDGGDQFIDRQFTNITHCLAHEGSASAVCLDENSNDFIKGYFKNVVVKVHLPMHLLAFHAEKALQYYASQNHLWLEPTNDGVKAIDSNLLKKLEEQQAQLFNFDLKFYPPIISTIGTHNQLYRQLLAIKQLPQSQQKIASDNQRITKLISDTIREQKQQQHNEANKSYCRIAQIGTAAAGFLTIKTIVDELVEVGLSFLNHESMEYLEAHKIPGIISISTAILGALIIWKIARKHCNHAAAQHAHGPADHAAHSVHTRELLHKKKH